MKNRYVGRTFIMPDQRMREVRNEEGSTRWRRLSAGRLGVLYMLAGQRWEGGAHASCPGVSALTPTHPPTLLQMSVRRKLNAMPVVFAGKSVLLIDDSIVRGTTMNQIVDMVRNAGAKKVYLASASPPVRYPNVYGVDMPTRSEFVAHNLTEDEICKVCGCGQGRGRAACVLTAPPLPAR